MSTTLTYYERDPQLDPAKAVSKERRFVVWSANDELVRAVGRMEDEARANLAQTPGVELFQPVDWQNRGGQQSNKAAVNTADAARASTSTPLAAEAATYEALDSEPVEPQETEETPDPEDIDGIRAHIARLAQSSGSQN